jgi:hypothetical protein
VTIRPWKYKKNTGLEVVCDATGCTPRVQSVPDDTGERDALLRAIGWVAAADSKQHLCPFCAGGKHLEKLRAAFEGRRKESLS